MDDRRTYPRQMSAALEQLSPELVLVSPELGEIARALLSERPWESFLHRAYPHPASVTRLQPDASLSSPGVLERAKVRRALPKPSFIALHRSALAGFAALLVVGSILPARDAPTLAPASVQQLGTPVIVRKRIVRSIALPHRRNPSLLERSLEPEYRAHGRRSHCTYGR